MKRWQKVILAFLGVLVILICGISAYGIKFMGEASKTVDQISKKSSRVSTKRDNTPLSHIFVKIFSHITNNSAIHLVNHNKTLNNNYKDN